MNRLSSPAVLKVERLAKSFGELRAVDGVSFHVAPGEIVGLVGPNGAGKTTTINMILGVLAPTAGRIEIEGVDLAADRSRALGRHQLRRRLRAAARQPDRRAEPARLRHDLCRQGPLRAHRASCWPSTTWRAFAAPRPGVLSSGEQTRLGLAKAMLNRPRLLLLDEPTASIDPSTARDIRAGIAKPSSTAATAGCFGPATTCTRSRRSATGCCSCRAARSLLEGDPKTLPREHGAASLDDLFVQVAHEALARARRAS